MNLKPGPYWLLTGQAQMTWGALLVLFPGSATEDDCDVLSRLIKSTTHEVGDSVGIVLTTRQIAPKWARLHGKITWAV